MLFQGLDTFKDVLVRFIASTCKNVCTLRENGMKKTPIDFTDYYMVDIRFQKFDLILNLLITMV